MPSFAALHSPVAHGEFVQGQLEFDEAHAKDPTPAENNGLGAQSQVDTFLFAAPLPRILD